MNRSIVAALSAIALSTTGCGVESASTAATAAALKQKELEAGKKTLSEAERKIGEAVQLQQQGAQKSGEADKQ